MDIRLSHDGDQRHVEVQRNLAQDPVWYRIASLTVSGPHRWHAEIHDSATDREIAAATLVVAGLT